MRLDQFISQTTGLSRKAAKRAIHAGEVSIDGVACRRTAVHVGASNTVTLQDQPPLALPGETYLMLHKPAGVVSATDDPDHATAVSLIPQPHPRGLHMVGRLDRDTTGLLLLTTDGQWSHRITSPRHHCPKTYRVTLAEPLTDATRDALESGVQLSADATPTRPAQVEVQAPDIIDLTITEGRYHQVKRMLAAAGNHVTALQRVKIGAVTLDPELAPGEWRPLTEAEVRSLGQ